MTGELKRKLRDKKYRDAYVAEHITTGIPYQVKTLRTERGWTQEKLGEKTDKPQNVISRLEDPNYGKINLGTLLDLASAFDVALLVKFTSFSRFVEEFRDVSPENLTVRSFDDEMEMLDNATSASTALEAEIEKLEKEILGTFEKLSVSRSKNQAEDSYPVAA